MRSVDFRTRTSANLRSVDPVAFFGDELPSLATERAGLAADGARALGLRAFGIEVDGEGWTVDFDGDRFSVVPGTGDAAAIVRLDQTGLHDLVNDLRTPMGFLTGGDLDMPKGRLEHFLDWWVVLRALLDGRSVHVPGSVEFRDAAGDPLDLRRAFRIDGDAEEISHFLGEAGFVHLESVFDAGEMAAVSRDMDAAAPRYTAGDGRSWWARTHDGENRLVRMQYFQEESPAAAALLADERLERIAGLTADGHRLGKPGGNSIRCEALVKPIGIVEGISDVPWHKDCSLGSHSYRCCSLTVGISVTGAGADTGQLRVVAGSHRALIQPAFVRRGLDLPQLDLPTQTGDVTVHLSCTLHMSQPPVSSERRVMYTDCSLPTDEGARSPNEDVLRRIREGAPTTVSQLPGHVAS